MPLLIHVVSVWIAGLLAAAFAFGAGNVLPVRHAAVLCGVAAAALAMRHVVSSSRSGTSLDVRIGTANVAQSLNIRMLAITTTACAALTTGLTHWQSRASCMQAMLGAFPLHVIVDESVAPRGFTRGVAIGRDSLAHCTVPVTLKVSEGSATAGAHVTVHGAALVGPRALRITGSVAVVPGKRSVLRAWRAKAGDNIDRLFGERAALVRALLIADQDGIDPQVRDRYADAGIVHLLSISGLHVAIIAEALLILTTAMRLSRAASSVSSLCIIAFYVLLLGAPPSAVRSAVMMGTLTVTERLQRPVHPWTALALGAWIPTIDPGVVVHLGWQLSVGGMAALLAAREILRRIRHYEKRRDVPMLVDRLIRAARDSRGWRAWLLREVITGIVATAVTAPLIAWHFGRVSAVAPLTNIAAGPIVGFLQPALFLALLLAPLEPLARFVASACNLPIIALDAVATFSAALPVAALRMAPTLLGAICAGAATASVVRATASRRMTPGIVAALAFLAVGAASPLLSIGSGRVELHVIDVGQGDGLAVRTPRGRWVIMDAGPSFNGGDAGRRVVVPYVQRRGGRVAAFLLSHAHDDHVGGARSVVEALAPAAWYEPAYITTTPSYRNALVAVQRRDMPWHRVRPGDSLVVDGVVFEFLGPDSVWTSRQTNPNEASTVVLVRYRGARFLLTGDAEHEEEHWLVEHWGSALRAHVLKLGHHGSKTSSSRPFLDAVLPLLGVASVGAGNRFGHPSPETLESLHARGIPVLRTDHEGSVVFASDGRTLEVITRRERFTLPLE